MFLFFLQTTLSLWGSPNRPKDQNGFPYLPDCRILYHENFSDPNALDYWIPTMHFRYTGKWKAEQTFPLQTRRGERAIVMKEKEKPHAISHKFRHPIVAPNETLVIQYEMRSQFLFTCTSAFMKIFTSPDFDPTDLSNSTDKFIEFGPERCGPFNQTRLNFFTKDENGKQIEHKLKHPYFIPVDEISHLYTLIIRPNNTFEYLIDNRSMRNGTFTDDFDIPLVEGPTMDDPNDVKPSDWDDRPIIPDPYEVKPADWDDNAPNTIPDPKKLNPPEGWLLNEPQHILDTESKKPREWNEQLMGEWKPQLVPNPKCIKAPGCGPYKPPRIRNPKARGVWKPKMVPNPFYKGEWRPKQIPNPNYKLLSQSDNHNFVMPPITGIGFDLWTAQREFAFTNILIATNETAVKSWNNEDFNPRQRRQIRAMKINYQWIFTDEPPDRPGPGVTGYAFYLGRCVKRQWARVPNKPAVVAISVAVILITIPLTIICCDIFSDPFEYQYEKKHQ
ncbi:Calnexin 1 [Tritrichomonas foetus]|uniref:Calnexin 1 n=1 Tax=Tritrichomonas foetus TaxID=1144522 RepID=A0A1J4KLV3_9EUKA|nr:Calnexin 1 [Tritrichomonas foetus]|eukprot:OHT12281.1 Calnexin 1 [Tritrichomonas foetus]